MFNPQNLNRYSYVGNRPINYNDPSGHCAEPASGTVCMALIPTGPVGWFVIGVLLLIDVALVAYVINDIAQTHTPPMGVANGSQSHTPPIGAANQNPSQQHTPPITSSNNSTGSTHTQPLEAASGTNTHTSPLSTDEGRIIVLQAKTKEQILKSIRSLQKQITIHEEKIQSYIENPDLHDNKGLLANAKNEVHRNLIIQNRIRHLQNEITKFQNEINKLQNQLKKTNYRME